MVTVILHSVYVVLSGRRVSVSPISIDQVSLPSVATTHSSELAISESDSEMAKGTFFNFGMAVVHLA